MQKRRKKIKLNILSNNLCFHELMFILGHFFILLKINKTHVIEEFSSYGHNEQRLIGYKNSANQTISTAVRQSVIKICDSLSHFSPLKENLCVNQEQK